MATQHPLSEGLQVLLVESSGPIFAPLSPDLVVQATLMPGRSRVTLVARSRDGVGPWAEHSRDLDDDAAMELACLYDATGIADGTCEVRERACTSDTASQLLIHVQAGQGESSLTVSMCHSGFEGPGAAALRAFGRGLLDAVHPGIYSITLIGE